MVIEDIEIPAVLGYDLMFDINNQTILINDQTVLCKLESQLPNLFRITIEKDITIPEKSEMIIQGKPVQNTLKGTTTVINSTTESLQNKGVLVAKSLCTAGQQWIPLRVINVSDQPQPIFKNTLATTVETIPDQDIFYEQRVDHPPNISLSEEMLNRCHDQLTPDQYQIVQELINRNKNVCSTSKYDKGLINVVKHKIDTNYARPIKPSTRRHPKAQRKEVGNEIQKLLDHGIISPSKSPWSGPLVVVRKANSSLRLCCDLRKINQITVRDSYPLPTIDDSLDALRGNTWFSTIDLVSGYYQCAMDPIDALKTSFVTSKGLFQFNRMPFGLSNAGATFKRLMESVSAGLQWETCIVYLDDIIVFSQTFDEHVIMLQSVFDQLYNAGLKISPKKCHFVQQEVNFLGHVVSSTGISPDPSKIDAVQDWLTPKNVKEVRAFLGTCSCLRKFIQDFSKKAKPLHRLIEKNTIFKWTQYCEAAFHTLKEVLTMNPILVYPSPEKEFILDTDASGTGMGAFLSQIDDNKEHVIAYYSKSFSKAERQYCVTRRELLAIVMAVKYFHYYLYGVSFLVRTDHGALTWLTNFKNPEGQLARWLEILGTYNYTIKHRAGPKHNNADGLI
ncbi:unnamed protein product [Mytilus coruscus]|uniref:Reverse transcriptase domain-containing protein n=1 Tax=Mytilus coruscus TaxID=42192 RepID=A0A6J8EI40_MYTCO|nr:unnamed protein product [Mytilus coruscus]